VGFEPTDPCGSPDFESLEMAFPGCLKAAFVSVWKRRKSLISCGFDGTNPLVSGLLKE
jgi:hypothetical protein